MEKQVYLYERVSTHGQEKDGYSLDEQSQRLRSYCAARDWTVIGEFRDVSTGSNVERPDLQNMIEEIRYCDVVLVYKLDRLSRKQKDTLYLIEDVFEPAGVGFVSLTENFDTTSPYGKAMIGILSAFAQLERELIKERMALGKRGRSSKGKPSAWMLAPHGYKYIDGAFVVDELAAEQVKRIFNMYLEGMPFVKILDTLNAEGHIGKDCPYSYNGLRTILKNPTYAGFTPYKGELFQGQHEAFISLETFDKTQAELQRRQEDAYSKFNITRPFQSKYMLSGLLRCGRCGSKFELIQGPPRKDGSRYKRYSCISKASPLHARFIKKAPEKCDTENYALELLEGLVLDEVEKLRLNPNAIVAERPQDADREAKTLESELDTLNNKLKRLLALYVEGDMPLEMLNEQRESIEAQRIGITERIHQIKKATPMLQMEVAREKLAKCPSSVRELDYETQKILVRELIERIELDGENMQIRWRFAS